MDSKFWIDAWKEGRTAFHQEQFHEKLLAYFPRLTPQAGQKVLVPLCGKTRDMIWLHDLGLKVYGIELYEEAVKDFFTENNLNAPMISEEQNFKNYSFQNITISCGDFFKFNNKEAFDIIYDRAALVALPESMRKDYAKIITASLKKNGKYLLISYEYNQTEMEGPPFSVSESEIQDLYKNHFTIEQLESIKPTTEGSRLSAVSSMKQNVFLLQKN